MKGWVVLKCVLVLTIASKQATYLTCLQCNNIDLPRLCTTVTHCNDGDVCKAEKFVNGFGETKYDMGCSPKNNCHIVSSTDQSSNCTQCCNQDLCTNDACGAQGYGSLDGPICYSCTQPTPSSLCSNITFCAREHECNVVGKLSFDQMVYTSQCMSRIECESHHTGGSIIGRRHFETSLADEHAKRSPEVHECDICCSTQLCNSECARAVDGGWGDWGIWSQCSQTCDNGTQTRGRSCDSPEPAGGGAVCTGLNSQSRGCFELSCPADCSDLLKSGRTWPSGVYTMVTWHTHKRVNVFCDMETDGGGWTVFQHRVNGSVDFYKNFHSYEIGFGSLQGEFWQGLQLLHELTSRRHNNTLRVDLQLSNGTRAYDVYEGFSIGRARNYVLHVGKRIDSLNLTLPGNLYPYHNGLAFSTFDHDRDALSRTNCAKLEHGAWWYNECYYANLNGQYFVPGTHNAIGMTYDAFMGTVSLKESKMMFK